MACLASVSGLAQCRVHVRRYLDEFDIDDYRTQDVVLAVDELASNALRHGHPPVYLRLECGARDVWIEVFDAGADFLSATIDATHGLGIVRNLSAAWGVVPGAGGKTVWLALPQLPG